MVSSVTGVPVLKGSYEILPMARVIYGPGQIAQLPAQADALGAKRALIITGNTLATQTELVDQLRGVLGDRCAGVFSASKQHVPRQTVLEATEAARSAGADLLISFGGGSPIDISKAVALCLAEDVTTPEHLDRYRIKFQYPDQLAIPAMTGQAIPHLAISTTLSVGEFTHIAGVTDEVRKVKDLYLDPQLTPRVVFLDPELAVATAPWLWASTGMRAVDHATEAIYSLSHMPVTDALCTNALTLLFEYLPRASQDPSDVAARGQTQVAAWMSIWGLANVQVGLSHGIGHQLGARCNVPHGVTSCIMLPHVMDYNRPVTADRQAVIARAIGVDTRGMSDEEAAGAAAERMREFIKGLGVPTRLRDVGVTEDDFAGIAKDALEDLVVATNPRPIRDREEVLALLRQAW